MNLKVSGKNVDIGDALRTRINDRVNEAVAKYFDGNFGGHFIVEHEGSGFRCEGAIHLDTGITLQATGRAPDAYASADQAVDRMEKRLRRYNRRLKDHRAAETSAGLEAQAYILASPGEEGEEVAADYAPLVVAETTQRIRTLTVGMAVMDLDLTGAPVLVFKNAGTGGINVVYKRPDGNIGWIDPALNAERAAS